MAGGGAVSSDLRNRAPARWRGTALGIKAVNKRKTILHYLAACQAAPSGAYRAESRRRRQQAAAPLASPGAPISNLGIITAPRSSVATETSVSLGVTWEDGGAAATSSGATSLPACNCPSRVSILPDGAAARCASHGTTP